MSDIENQSHIALSGLGRGPPCHHAKNSGEPATNPGCYIHTRYLTSASSDPDG
jgi:hypothetical protein